MFVIKNVVKQGVPINSPVCSNLCIDNINELIIERLWKGDFDYHIISIS